jgi:hypothetical protein
VARYTFDAGRGRSVAPGRPISGNGNGQGSRGGSRVQVTRVPLSTQVPGNRSCETIRYFASRGLGRPHRFAVHNRGKVQTAVMPQDRPGGVRPVIPTRFGTWTWEGHHPSRLPRRRPGWGGSGGGGSVSAGVSVSGATAGPLSRRQGSDRPVIPGGLRRRGGAGTAPAAGSHAALRSRPAPGPGETAGPRRQVQPAAEIATPQPEQKTDRTENEEHSTRRPNARRLLLRRRGLVFFDMVRRPRMRVDTRRDHASSSPVDTDVPEAATAGPASSRSQAA